MNTEGADLSFQKILAACFTAPPLPYISPAPPFSAHMNVTFLSYGKPQGLDELKCTHYVMCEKNSRTE